MRVKVKDFFIQITVVSIFVFIMVTIFPTESFLGKGVNAIYSIDINPEILILVDEDERVLLLEGINQESQTFVKSIKYHKKPLKQIVEAIVKKAVEEGFAQKDEESYVVLSRLLVDQPTITSKEELVDIVYENIGSNVSVLFYEGYEEVLAVARSKGQTPGTFLLQQSLIENQIIASNQKVSTEGAVKIAAQYENLIPKKEIFSGQIEVVKTEVEEGTEEIDLEYYLKKNKAERVQLVASDIASMGFDSLATGDEIYLEGRMNYPTGTIEVSSLQGVNRVAGFPIITNTTTTGERKILVITANYQDEKVDWDIDYIKQAVFSNNYMSVNSWFKDASYNQLKFSGEVVGPYNLSLTSNADCNIYSHYEPAKNAAINAGVNVNAYQHIVILVPYSNKCRFTFKAQAHVHCINQCGVFFPGNVMVNRNANEWQKGHWVQVLVHEIGHNLGLMHSQHQFNMDSFDSGDTSCIMGTGMTRFNAPQFLQLKWNQKFPNYIQKITTSGDYKLFPMTDGINDSVHPRILYFETEPNTFYTISDRFAHGRDKDIASAYTMGLNIHKYTPNQIYNSTMVTNLVGVHRNAGNSYTFKDELGRNIKITQHPTQYHIAPVFVTGGHISVSVDFGDLKQQNHQLTINSFGATGVPIKSSNNYSGTTSYNRSNIASGTTVHLEAPLQHGNARFVNWTGTGCESTNPKITLTMVDNRTCVANYSSDASYIVTYDGNGGICNPATQSVNQNGNATVPTCNRSHHQLINYSVVSGHCGQGFVASTGQCRGVQGNITIRANWQSSAPSPLAAPTNLKCNSVTGNQINLSWNAVSGATRYQVYFCEGSNCQNLTLVSTVNNSTNYVHPNLKPNTTYRYQVIAANNTQTGAKSTITTCQTSVESIARPTGVTCHSSSENQVNVSWNEVANAQGYHVYSCTGANCMPTGSPQHSTRNSLVFSNLAPNTTYRYRVITTSNLGNSDYSNITACHTGSQKLTKPNNVTCQVQSSNQISLTWQGVQAASNYLVYRCEGSSCTPNINAGHSNNFQYSDAGLKAGTTYRYHVVATNANNHSDASNMVTCRTSTTQLTKPTNLRCSSNQSNQIELLWNTVSGAQGYSIYRCIGSDCLPSSFLNVSTSARLTDSLSQANNIYRYRVVAVGSNGINSDVSDIVSCQTSSTQTQLVAPTNVQCNALASNQIDLTWNNVANAQGYYVFRCEGVNCLPSSHISNTNQLRFQNVGVSHNTVYRYRIVAYSGSIISNFSQIVTCQTAQTRLTPPTTVRCNTVSPQQINLSWNLANNAQRYFVYRCEGNNCLPTTYIGQSTTNSFENSNLRQGVVYRYRIVSLNSNNESGFSEITSCQTGSNQLSAPTNARCSVISNNRINFMWDAVLGADSYYVVRCEGLNCTPNHNVSFLRGTKYEDSGLKSNTMYRYLVMAFNSSQDRGSSSAIVTCQTEPPATVSNNLRCNVASANQINLSWDAVAGANNYFLYTCEGANCHPYNYIGGFNSSILSFQRSGIKTGATYRFQVVSNQSDRTANFSNIVTCTTSLTAVTVPTNLRCGTSAADLIYLNWDTVSGARTYWVYSCQGDNCLPTIYTGATTVSNYSHGAREPGKTYRYRVIAAGDQAYSNYSEVVTCKTSDHLSAPTGLNCRSTAWSNELYWNRASGAQLYYIYATQEMYGTPNQYLGQVGNPTFIHNNLARGTYYKYNVRSFANGKFSETTPTIQCITAW